MSRGANDSAEKSVSTIVDGVSLYYSGQAWANYVDLDRIEVLSGPQGTLQGKNSSLGAIRIITKAPSFEKSGSYELSVGQLDALNGKFSATGPLIDDKLAYRGTFLRHARQWHLHQYLPVLRQGQGNLARAVAVRRPLPAAVDAVR